MPEWKRLGRYYFIACGVVGTILALCAFLSGRLWV